MKKIVPILLALLLLTGCKIETDIRPDTIVDIPLEPTEEVTEAVTEEPTEATEPPTETPTEAPSEAPTEAATEKPTEKPKSSSKGTSTKKPSGSSSKKPSSDNASKKDNTTKATESTKATEAPKPTEPPTEPPTQAPTRPAGSYSPGKLDKAIIAAVNDARAEAGLPELGTGRKLTNAAGQRARELSTHWSHTRPDGSDFTTVLAEFGVGGSNVTEKNYYDLSCVTAEEIVDLWLADGGTSILSQKVDTIGVGSYEEDGMVYICALFIG